MKFEDFEKTVTVEIEIDTYRQGFEIEEGISEPGVPVIFRANSKFLPSTCIGNFRAANQMLENEEGKAMLRKIFAYEVFKKIKQLKSEKRIVAETWLFPNEIVVTVGYDNQQIPELQGKYTHELLEKITQHSDDSTIWNGFHKTA